MTSSQFQDRLSERADNAGVPVIAAARAQLEAYFRLLAHWNAKINLTALPMQQPTDETFDRLLIEPLVAARCITDSARTWFDLGSGGGSPAIPMKFVHPSIKLTMIEAKARKAAFLREAVRTLGLTDALVENDRFENIAAAADRQSVDLVTVRAVKRAPGLFAVVHRLLSPTGRALFFHSKGAELALPDTFHMVRTVRLRTTNAPLVSILKPTPHNTRRRFLS